MVHGDERGYFYESYNKSKFDLHIGPTVFVQDNESYSSYGVLRGLHLQKPPFDQGKLVRVVYGSVYDVAVDLRVNSKTYGSWHAEILSEENKKQLWIPSGFAHGFLCLSDHARLLYKTTNFYNYDSEVCIYYKDVDLAIVWPELKSNYIVNDKDQQGIALSEVENYFI